LMEDSLTINREIFRKNTMFIERFYLTLIDIDTL